MKKSWIKEFARDFIALGSIPFFILVLVRVSILSKPYFLSQFMISGVLFILLIKLFKANLYSGFGLVMLIFTSLYYNDLQFAIFAILAYICLIVSLIYLDNDKKEILKGVLFGILSSLISYYAVQMIFF